MPNPYVYLYNTDGRAVCRATRAAADAGTWLPTDESVPANHILDGRPWEKVQVRPEFDIAPGGTGTVTVQLLKAVPRAGGGREWIEETAVAIAVNKSADFVIDGHLVAFRITAVTLGTANNVSIVATGGMWLRPKH
jgi:hypothetical protein